MSQKYLTYREERALPGEEILDDGGYRELAKGKRVWPPPPEPVRQKVDLDEMMYYLLRENKLHPGLEEVAREIRERGLMPDKICYHITRTEEKGYTYKVFIEVAVKGRPKEANNNVLSGV